MVKGTLCNQNQHQHAPLSKGRGGVQVQYYAGKAVETQAGFLRTMLIYIISGVGGYLISGIFSPHTVSVGANPAVRPVGLERRAFHNVHIASREAQNLRTLSISLLCSVQLTLALSLCVMSCVRLWCSLEPHM